MPEYTVTDHIPYRPVLEVTDYPKAGDPNPLVRVGIVPAAGGTDRRGPTPSAYSGVETLVVEVSWTPDSRQVEHQVQNREQTWLDMNLADAATGRTRTLLRETTKAWVNNNGGPVWLKDGSFLWFSERTGFKHLYRYRDSGTGPATLVGRGHVGTLGRAARSTAWTRPAGWSISRRPSRARSTCRSIASGSTARTARGCRRPAARIRPPSARRSRATWTAGATSTTPAQLRLHAADGAETPRDRGQPGAGAHRIPDVHGRSSCR